MKKKILSLIIKFLYIKIDEWFWKQKKKVLFNPNGHLKTFLNLILNIFFSLFSIWHPHVINDIPIEIELFIFVFFSQLCVLTINVFIVVVFCFVSLFSIIMFTIILFYKTSAIVLFWCVIRERKIFIDDDDYVIHLFRFFSL